MIMLLKTFKIFSHTYRINYKLYGLEIFFRDYPFIKSGRFEGIINWSKIDRMVNDHSSSCKL